MHLVITGSGGFVGKNLLNYFNQNNCQFQISYIKKDAEPNTSSIKWEHIDQLTKLSTNVIIHLAGKAHDLKNLLYSIKYVSLC